MFPPLPPCFLCSHFLSNLGLSPQAGAWELAGDVDRDISRRPWIVLRDGQTFSLL